MAFRNPSRFCPDNPDKTATNHYGCMYFRQYRPSSHCCPSRPKHNPWPPRQAPHSTTNTADKDYSRSADETVRAVPHAPEARFWFAYFRTDNWQPPAHWYESPWYRYLLCKHRWRRKVSQAKSTAYLYYPDKGSFLLPVCSASGMALHHTSAPYPLQLPQSFLLHHNLASMPLTSRCSNVLPRQYTHKSDCCFRKWSFSLSRSHKKMSQTSQPSGCSALPRRPAPPRLLMPRTEPHCFHFRYCQTRAFLYSPQRSYLYLRSLHIPRKPSPQAFLL